MLKSACDAHAQLVPSCCERVSIRQFLASIRTINNQQGRAFDPYPPDWEDALPGIRDQFVATRVHPAWHQISCDLL